MIENICRHFRSKTMYVSGREVPDEQDAESLAAGYCWCNCTMTEIGNDDHLVGLDRCSVPGRTCYEPR